jgi:pimeloyl-ACP methyl ester carboxylesterase
MAVLCAAVGCTRAPPSQKPPASADSRFAVLDGARLHYIDWGGTGEALVFVPGLGSSAHAFDDFAPRFTDRFRVVALTPRGMGDSEQTPSGYDTASLAEDVRALLDELHLPKATVVGHSFAGEVLTCLAARHPDRIARLVYLDAAYDHARALPLLPSMTPPPPPPPKPSKEETSSPAAFAAYLQRTFGMRMPDAEVEKLAALEADDRARFRAEVPHPTVVELHGANHWLWSSHPEEVERQIRAFVGAGEGHRPD